MTSCNDDVVSGSQDNYHAGFVALVGRPNTGKSTLTNVLAGQKIAITSSKPQTTRHNIRAIITNEQYQLILVDTPGLHRPRTLLGDYLVETVKATLSDVDAVVFCLPADEKIGPGDRYIAERLGYNKNIPVIALVTKTDTVSAPDVTTKLIDVDQFGQEMLGRDGFAEIIPVSAVASQQVDVVERVLAQYLPESPMLYPDEDITDHDIELQIGDLIREAILEDLEDELPHSVAVVIEEMQDRHIDSQKLLEAEKPAILKAQEAKSTVEGKDKENSEEELETITDIWASIIVERDSQKGIIIGHRGNEIKKIRVKSRREIIKLLGNRVYLELHVKVMKDWQKNSKYIQRLGFQAQE